MKIVILACLAAVAVAAPQVAPDYSEIIRDERVDNGDGNFNFAFETSNGISSNVQGVPGSLGQSNMQGGHRYTLDDGTVVELTFVADENGYRAESNSIPVAPPHVAELLRIAEEQRASGITFDQQGRRL